MIRGRMRHSGLLVFLPAQARVSFPTHPPESEHGLRNPLDRLRASPANRDAMITDGRCRASNHMAEVQHVNPSR